jgi:AraC-like DNA-binding protein
VYRTITNSKVFIAVFILLGSIFLFAKTDSLRTGQGSILLAENKDSEVKRSESLAVELLLKDLDLSTNDDSAALVVDPHGKTPVLSKTVMSSTLAEKKNSTSVSISNKQVLSGKLGHASSSGFAFFKVHALQLLVLTGSLLALFITILLIWLRKDNDRFLTTGRLSIMDKEVQRACDFVEENFSNQDLSIELLCREMVTGEAFLNALFIGELGITVENFIDQVRVNRVKIFLSKDLNITIEKLVLQTGFSGEKVLQDIFLTITGIEFDAYRNSLRVQESV